MFDFVKSTDERVSLSSDSHSDAELTRATASSDALTVSEYLKITDNAVKQFGFAKVVGEISEIKHYNHLYFKIKDEFSSVDCVMWAGQRAKLDFEPEVGQSVEIVGTSSIYQKTGQFKLIASTMQRLGLGLIMERLRKLREKLENEGIFEKLHREIPSFINTVGVITSTEGRVLHDIQMTMERRNDAVNIIVYPAKVQGDDAPESLIAALKQANEENRCDVLIIGRGGGSFEDLLAFSDESLVRAVSDSKIPIISAVGHEPDFALTDFAADLRAATPTAAAELVTSVTKSQLLLEFDEYIKKLDTLISLRLDELSIKADSLEKRLKSASPKAVAEAKIKTVDLAVSRLYTAVLKLHHDRDAKLKQYLNIVTANSPKILISNLSSTVMQSVQRLDAAVERRILDLEDCLDFESVCYKLDSLLLKSFEALKNRTQNDSNRLEIACPKPDLDRLNARFEKELSKLENLNPLAILKRGYSVTLNKNGTAVKASSLKKGDVIKTVVDDGTIESVVSLCEVKDEN